MIVRSTNRSLIALSDFSDAHDRARVVRRRSGTAHRSDCHVAVRSEPLYRFGAASQGFGEGMNPQLATLVIGCLMLLTIVGVIVKAPAGRRWQGRYLPILLGSGDAEREDLSAMSQGAWEEVVVTGQARPRARVRLPTHPRSASRRSPLEPLREGESVGARLASLLQTLHWFPHLRQARAKRLSSRLRERLSLHLESFRPSGYASTSVGSGQHTKGSRKAVRNLKTGVL